MPAQIPSPMPTSPLPTYQHVYLPHHHLLASLLVFPHPRLQNGHSSRNTVHCDLRIPDSEMPVAELEQLEILMALTEPLSHVCHHHWDFHFPLGFEVAGKRSAPGPDRNVHADAEAAGLHEA